MVAPRLVGDSPAQEQVDAVGDAGEGAAAQVGEGADAVELDGMVGARPAAADGAGIGQGAGISVRRCAEDDAARDGAARLVGDGPGAADGDVPADSAARLVGDGSRCR